MTSKVEEEKKPLAKKFLKNAYSTVTDIYNYKNINPKNAVYSTIYRKLSDIGLIAHI